MRAAKNDSLEGIQQIKKGQYLLRVTWTDPRTGRRKDRIKTVRCASMQEAAVHRSRMLAELTGAAKVPERVRVGDFARSWLSTRLCRLKPSTRKRYGHDLEIVLADLGDFYLDAIRHDDIEIWIARQADSGKAAATVNGYLRVLKTMLADAAVRHDLPRNPAARVRCLPERSRAAALEDGPRNLLTAGEMSAFLEALRTRWPQWYAMSFTQLATARRFGEVSALRWDDIDEQRGLIRIRRAHWQGHVGTTKTDREVTVPLIDELRQVLRDWRQELVRSQHRHADSGWVFPSLAGKPHHSSACMRKAFVDCLKVAGVERKFTSHGLRRTANDLLRRLAAGEVVRAITGHVTVEMTEHYSHIDQQEKRAAVEGMLRLIRGGKAS